jgi:hypothetical protein
VVAGNVPDAENPLQTWRNRPGSNLRSWQHVLPELHVTIGRDTRSSGLTISVWEPTGGEFPSYRTLYAARWRDPVLTTEEALRIVYQGVAAALAELFDVHFD